MPKGRPNEKVTTVKEKTMEKNIGFMCFIVHVYSYLTYWRMEHVYIYHCLVLPLIIKLITVHVQAVKTEL